MKIFFIFFLFFFSHSYAQEVTFLCKISEELENGKPAEKKNYEQTPIYLYLDKNEKWFGDVRKKEFVENEKDLLGRVRINFIEKKKIIIFKKKFIFFFLFFIYRLSFERICLPAQRIFCFKN